MRNQLRTDLAALRTLVLILLALGIVSPVMAAPVEESPLEGYRAPRFQLPDLEGQRHSLRQYRGNVILMRFWASWCGPCLTEMPQLQALHDEFSDAPFQVIAISEDTRIAQAQRFVEGKNFGFLILHDTGQRVSRDYRVRGLPTTFLLDADGVVLHRVIGPADWTSEEWMSVIRKHLPETSDAPPEPADR